MAGYLHNLSPSQAKSQNKNQYVSLNFQTKSQVYRVLSFFPERYAVLKGKFESSSPVRINMFQPKKNPKTEKEESIFTKRKKD